MAGGNPFDPNYTPTAPAAAGAAPSAAPAGNPFDPSFTGTAGTPSNPAAPKSGGWGLNPFTDVMKATTGIGDWINQHTQIGSFNPGVGSLISGVANIVPGLANTALKVGQTITGNENAADQLGQIGGAMAHGFKDTAVDVATGFGVAPWTGAAENALGGTSLKNYATRPGQGLLGGALNDTMNALMVTDGLGAAAKSGAIGEAADAAIKAGELGAGAGIDVRAPLDVVKTGQDAAMEAKVQQLADQATTNGGDPTAVAQQIRDRIAQIQKIDTAKGYLSAPIAPWKLLREPARYANTLLSDRSSPAGEPAVPSATMAPDALEGTTAPLTGIGGEPAPETPEEMAQSSRIAVKDKLDQLAQPEPEAAPKGNGATGWVEGSKPPVTTMHITPDMVENTPRTTVNVPIDKIAVQQGHINPDVVKDIVANGLNDPEHAGAVEAMSAGNGNYLLENGNHRLAAAMEKGEPSIPVDVTGEITHEGLKAHIQEKLDARAAEDAKGAQVPEGEAKTTEEGTTPGNPKEFVSDNAKEYAAASGLPEPKPVDLTAKVDPIRGNIVARIYEAAVSRPDDPRVVRAYRAFVRDTMQQWEFLKSKGVKVDFVSPVSHEGIALESPYATAEEMMADVRNNNHLSVNSTPPEQAHSFPGMNATVDYNPDGSPISVNDVFRAVHDYFGHSDAMNDFGRHGEDVAWRLHSSMYSPEAQPALYTETVGQNSYLNFLPENVNAKRLGLTPQFPEQKAALLPELVQAPDWAPAGPKVAEAMANSLPMMESVPRAVETFLERSAETPRWAKALVDRLPQPLVGALAWTDRLRLSAAYKAIDRQNLRALAVVARQVENSPEIEAIRQQAVKLVTDRVPGVTPGVASDIIGERVRAAVMLGPLWHELEGMRPGLDGAVPGLTDHILSFANDLPTDTNTPEFRQIIQGVADPIRNMRIQAEAQLKSSIFYGDQGLDRTTSDAPTMTAAERKMARDMQSKINQAAKLEGVNVPKELAAAQKELLRLHDAQYAAVQDGALAAETGASALQTIDRARKYVPWAFQSDERLAMVADEIASRIIATQGATFDPHTAGGRWLEMGDPDTVGYMVGGVKGSAMQIPVEDFAAVGEDGRTGGAHSIEAFLKQFQNAYQFKDMMVGGWVDGDQVHLDPSQFIAGDRRDYAMSLGAAREQLSVAELHTASFPDTSTMDPNIATGFLDGNGGHAARDNRSGQIRSAVDAQIRNGAQGIPTEDIDKQMAWNDRQAYLANQLNPEQYPTQDSWYRQSFKTEYGKEASTNPSALNEIRPMITERPQLLKIARQVFQRGGDEGRWYFQAHDYIERTADGMPDNVDLGMGTPWSVPKTVATRDLFYDMIAVNSMNTDPAQNFIWGLGAVRNWVAANKGDLSEFRSAVDEWARIPHDQRTPLEGAFMDGSPAPKGTVLPKLLQMLGKDTNQLARRYMLAILDGHTIDTWDEKFFADDGAFNNYGNQPKGLSMANVPKSMIDELGPDAAQMEYHGSGMAAKIRSFRDNLANPETSMAVTLDSWMARLFGPRDTFWGTKGQWYKYATTIRGVADDLGKELGRTVMPHEVQAALWFWAKEHYANVNAAATRAMGIEVLRQLEGGNWTPENDPMAQFWAQAEHDSKTVGGGRGSNPAPKTPMLTTQAPEIPVEAINKGEPLPETTTEDVNYRNPRAKTSRGQVVQTQEGNSITLGRQEYDGVMENVKAALHESDVARASGDDATAQGWLEEAKGHVWDYVKKSDNEWEARKEGLQFWDAPSRPSFPAFNETLTDTLGLHVATGPLAEMFAGELRGQFIPKPAGEASVIRLFKTADLVTMFHENGHLLRSLMTGDDLTKMEAHYGVEGGKWTTDQEEQFVHDMVTSATTQYTGPMAPYMSRLRQVLSSQYDDYTQTYDATSLHPEIANFWGQLFNPETVRSSDALPGPDIGGGTQLVGHTGTLEDTEGKSPAQVARLTPKSPVDETKGTTYRRGLSAQEGLDKWREAMQQKREAAAAGQRAQSAADDLEKVLTTHSLPSQLAAASLRGEAADMADKLGDSLENASESRLPPKWQPLMQAAKRIADSVQQYPELEDMLTSLPKVWGDVLDYAEDNGFDPVHMPDLTPQVVRTLVNGTVRLGGEPGKQFESGARKVRSGALRAQDLEDRSIESIIAGVVRVTQEDRTNMTVDWVDRVAAQDIPTDAAGRKVVPRTGWVAWDPLRRSMLSTENQAGDMQSMGASKMIPRSVAHAIQEYSSSVSNPLARAMQTATDPWRFFMLTLNPSFYVRHFSGHVLLAAIQEGGFKLSDWTGAFKAAKEGFKNMPEVTGQNITQAELGQPGVVTYPSFADALAQGGKREALAYVANQAHKAVGVGDSFARAVIYLSDIRKGATEMQALQHAQDALVDYGNLSNTERYFARSIIPFYGFQKGILKIAMSMPIDHPLVSSVLLQLGKYQGEKAVDDNGNPLPDRYQGVVNLPFLGKTDLRPFSPFKDLGALTTADGLVGSLQYGLQAVVRSGLGVAAPGTKAGVKVNKYGQVVPDVPLAGQLAASVSSSPQGQLISGGSSALKFLGVPQIPQTTLDKAGARNVLSQAEVANAPQALQEKAASMPIDTHTLLNNLSTTVASGNPLALPQPDLGGAAPTQAQAAAALVSTQQAQAAASAATRASNKAAGKTPKKRTSFKVKSGSSGTKAPRAHKVSAGTTHSTKPGKTRVKALRQALGKAHNASRSGGKAKSIVKSSIKGVPGIKH